MDVNTITGNATPTSVSGKGASAPSPSGIPSRPDSAPLVAARNAIESVIVRQEFPTNTRLRLDKESNRIVAEILDENNEVIRQLPPQELLDISARFNRLEGIIFDELR